MSLFKARDWWSTSVGEEEEFDQGCLCVANIDNSSDELGTFSCLVTDVAYLLIRLMQHLLNEIQISNFLLSVSEISI